MVRYRFVKDYDHPISFGVDKAYRAGMELAIPDAHADGADAAKAGERVPEKSSKVVKAGAERG